MSFCPECRYEYREGIDICTDCSTPLVENLVEVTDFSGEKIKWKKLRGQPGMVYTEMIKEVLEDKGIPCILQYSGSWSSVHGTELFGTSPFLIVPEDRYEECIRIIDEMLDHI